MAAPWSQLVPDLLRKISEGFLTHPSGLSDYVRFRAVCVSWRSSTPPQPPLLPLSQFPLLMLSFDENSYTRSFFCLSGGTTHTLSLPFTHQTRILGSVDGGWLLVINNTAAVSLLNPLTSAVIHLPPLTTLSRFIKPREDAQEGSYVIIHPDDEFVIYTKKYGNYTSSATDVRDLFLHKVILSADGTAVGISPELNRLVFTRPGENWWKAINKQCTWTDVLAFQGIIYAVNMEGVVWRCEIGQRATVTRITSEFARRHSLNLWYLVESLGELLVVAAQFKSDLPPNSTFPTEKFMVFRLDRLDDKGGQLVEIKSLGDHRMLFLGTNTSVSLSVSSDYPEWKGNRIYFTPSYFEVYGDCSHGSSDSGVYNMEDGSIESLPSYPDNSTVVWPPPLWFTPNFHSRRTRPLN